MPTETIDYRGYRLAIYAPRLPNDVWRILVHGPKDQRPNARPPFQFKHEAIAEARTYLDKALGKDAAP
jgi:hypothetical protein